MIVFVGLCRSKPQTIKLAYKKLPIGIFLLFAPQNSVEVISWGMGITFCALNIVLVVNIEPKTKTNVKGIVISS